MKLGTLQCLSKSETSGFRMHGNPVKGEYEHDPEIGKGFTMLSNSLDAADGVRWITTTPVKALEKRKDNAIYFETESGSRYELSWA